MVKSDTWNPLVNPTRTMLYTPSDLFGTDIGGSTKYQDSYDYKVYEQYVKLGDPERASYADLMVQAMHDTSISYALRTILSERQHSKKNGVVAIMGGHSLNRDSDLYRIVVNLARRLTQEGFLVASGGGPGAMEAAHLGALLSNSAWDAAVDACINHLAQSGAAGFPKDLKLHEALVAEDPELLAEELTRLQQFMHPAFQLLAQVRATQLPLGESLGIPTWHYGHEPPTPFATHIAKYFQNSIREDGLLARAQSGVVYVQGNAGTLQEVFQDAAQNYYRSFEYFSPMVFFEDIPNYWQGNPIKENERTIVRRPVRQLLDSLFLHASREATRDEYRDLVAFVGTVDEAVTFITEHESERAKVRQRITSWT